MRLGGWLGVMTLAVLSSVPALASAQPSDPDTDRIARERFVAGREAFSRGDFAGAATAFERAYLLSRRPQLLYNLGTAYDRLHRWERARESFQRYLDAVPDAPDRAEVEGRLAIIEVELQHQAERNAPPQVVVVERPTVEPARPWRTVFWVTGGLAALTGVGTVAVGLLADRQYSNLLRGCATTSNGCDPASIDDIALRQGIINGGIVLSSALAATAITALFLDRARTRPGTTHITTPTAALSPLPGGMMLHLGGVL